MLLCGSTSVWVIPYAAQAQLQVNPFLAPAQLAATLAGPGVSVFNVSHTGDSLSIGSFSSSGNSPGLASGILLSTGPVGIAIGPNSANNAGAYFNQAGDSLLGGFTSVNLFDASVLEFDFIPQSDTVRFRYVFASEEYPEFVCSNYNDIFAFFISGPGITGVANMAVLPGTTAPVAINSINGGSMGASVTVTAPCDTANVSLYIDNAGGQQVQYDGYTAVMEAVSTVVPCETYHLKIVIADAGDGFYDSGVFLEAGSMVSPPVVQAGNDTSVCSGAQIQLGGPAVPGWTYTWSPSAGLSLPTASSPVFTALNTGTTTLTSTYVVTAGSGSCVLTDTVIVSVTPQPAAIFTIPDGACQDDTIALNYVISASPQAQISWSFGGSPTTQQTGGSYLLSWNQPGLHPINLVVQQGLCSAMFGDSIQIHPRPDPTFIGGPVMACVPVGLQVQPASSNAGINITSVDWSFGDGSSSQGLAPQHQYTQPGSYAVRLTLCSDQGCCSDSSISAYAQAFAVPSVSFTGAPLSGCVPHTVSFNAQVDSFGVGLASTELAYGDGLEESGFNFTHTYTDTGYFDVSFVACTVEGCCADTLKAAYVRSHPTPRVSFTAQPLTGCAPLDVTFNGIVDNQGATISTIEWQRGDGSVTTQVNQFSYRYENPGMYSVQLTACSDQGCCADTLREDYIEVYQVPEAAFSYTPLQPDIILSELAFTDLSQFADYWEWSFGDGLTSNLNAPIHQYTDTGIYKVVQIVRTIEGCSDSTAQLVDIRPVPAVWIPSAFSPNGDGKNDVFEVKGAYLRSVAWNIFNRWGDSLASGTGIGSGWDGDATGVPCPEGVYLYAIETEDMRGDKRAFRGRVTLMR